MGMSIDLKQECKYCYREIDNSGLEGFRCTNKTVNMETSWCRPKNADEPCSICEYCEPKEEIEMSIDEHIKRIGDIRSNYDRWSQLGLSPNEAKEFDVAIETMRKYQKIEQILNRLKVRMKDRDEDNGGEPLNAVDRGYHLAYEHLCEEIDNLLKENEDGKID